MLHAEFDESPDDESELIEEMLATLAAGKSLPAEFELTACFC